MIRKVTKMSTVTPKSTLTKSKSIGQGVKNIANAKKYGPVSMATGKKFTKEAAAEMMQPSFESFSKADKNRIASSIAAGATASTIMPKPKKRIPTNKTTTSPKAKVKAKMLPEVKVTAPGKLKRFVSKLTSKRK
jgi:hypothetical protein